MTPSQIVKYLDQHVVGQKEAKRQLAVAIHTHYKKIALAGPDKVEIIKPTDLFEFGLIQEFAGRLPIVAHFNPLSRDMMVRIMSEPKNSIYKQYRQMLANDGVELTIEALVFEQIADLAMEYGVGARSLRGIFEEMLTPTMYLLPDHPEVRQVRFASLFDEPKFIGTRPPG